jgi:hypothetical protein
LSALPAGSVDLTRRAGTRRTALLEQAFVTLLRGQRNVPPFARWLSAGRSS